MMTNELQVIHDQEVLGKGFKIYGDADNPLFLAKDVTEWIGYDPSSVNKIISNVDDDEKLNGTIFRSGQNREVLNKHLRLKLINVVHNRRCIKQQWMN
ncbi:prophage antirepressor-like protein [Bacillus sp. RC252]